MGFSLGKVFKPISKGFNKIARMSREGGAAVAGIANGMTGGALQGLVDATEPGNSAVRNAQKRADFEYARSLADQRAFQDDSIQRRVADARAAGIHPLAALGYQAPSFNPPQSSYYPQGEDNSLYEMGQNVSRAIAAGQTRREREATLANQSVIDALSVRRLELENKGLELDNLRKLSLFVRSREGVGPGFPDVNAIRNVGVQELGQGDIAKSTTLFRAPSGEIFTSQSAEFGEASENDPISAAIGMYHNWWQPYPAKWGRQFVDYVGNNFRIDNTHSRDYVGYPKRPYRVKNRVRGSRISSYHTQ